IGLAGYSTYQMYLEHKYKTPFSLYMDRHWEAFGLYKEKKNFWGQMVKERPYLEKEEMVTEFLYRAYFKLPVGMSVKDVKEKLDAIELAVNAEVDAYRKDEYCVLEFSTGHIKYQEN